MFTELNVTARSIFQQVLEGLLYLHSHNIVHRDLSLSNLLLSSSMDAVSLHSSKFCAVNKTFPFLVIPCLLHLLTMQKIADFGLAVELDNADEKHYTMCGTPNYIAP